MFSMHFECLVLGNFVCFIFKSQKVLWKVVSQESLRSYKILKTIKESHTCVELGLQILRYLYPFESV